MIFKAPKTIAVNICFDPSATPDTHIKLRFDEYVKFNFTRIWKSHLSGRKRCARLLRTLWCYFGCCEGTEGNEGTTNQEIVNRPIVKSLFRRLQGESMRWVVSSYLLIILLLGSKASNKIPVNVCFRSDSLKFNSMSSSNPIWCAQDTSV